MTPTLWLAVLATVAVTLVWPVLLASLDNRRHGKLTVNPPSTDPDDMMMRGYLKLLEFPEEIQWYDEQARQAGFYVATQRGLRLYLPTSRQT